MLKKIFVFLFLFCLFCGTAQATTIHFQKSNFQFVLPDEWELEQVTDDTFQTYDYIFTNKHTKERLEFLCQTEPTGYIQNKIKKSSLSHFTEKEKKDFFARHILFFTLLVNQKNLSSTQEFQRINDYFFIIITVAQNNSLRKIAYCYENDYEHWFIYHADMSMHDATNFYKILNTFSLSNKKS